MRERNRLSEAEKQEVVTTDQPQEAATNIIQVIERAAMNPNVDIDKMERLLQMQERIIGRQSEQEFNEAMNLCQEEMGPISQDAYNKQTKSKYSSYVGLDKAIRPIYIKHGFGLSFDTADGAPDNHVRVVCKVSHNGGHSEIKHLDMPNDGKGAKGGDVMTKTHATMSAVSYGRRGLLKMIFNLAEGESDDDGNKAGAGELISSEQFEELHKLCDDVGANKVLLCEFYDIDSLKEVPVANLEKVKATIEKKRGQ